MSAATTVLPQHDELLSRLTAVDSEPHMVERFYPHILTSAGQEKTGLGVALALTLAASDYTDGMPPVLARVVLLRLPSFVRAIVDDPQVQAEALAGLR
jgi:hypothetical protein